MNTANKMKLSKLINKAEQYYSNQNYQRELETWQKVLKIEPYNPCWKHNIALSLSMLERYEESAIIFEELIVTNPELSRVHNNYAYTLSKMGAESQTIFPLQLVALATSSDGSEFLRHFHNVAITASFSLEFTDDSDLSSDFILDELKEKAHEICDRSFKPPEDPDVYKAKINESISGYRDIISYRNNLISKNWGKARSDIKSAHKKLSSQSIHPALNIINLIVKPNFEVITITFKILELFASGKSINEDDLKSDIKKIEAKNSFLESQESFSHHRYLSDTTYRFIITLSETILFLSNSDCTSSLDELYEKIGTYDSYQNTIQSFYLNDEYVDIIKVCKEQLALLENVIESSLVEDNIQSEKKRSLRNILLFINGKSFSSKFIDKLISSEVVGVNINREISAFTKLIDFKHFIERQCAKDIYANGKPHEYIGRALLQSHLTSRSYREVQTRGGYTDILTFEGGHRYLYEVKIWRGLKYHQQGIREIEEYIRGEDDDGLLKEVFYVIFDPTKNRMAEKEAKKTLFKHKIRKTNITVNIVTININLEQPSRIK
ncbi:tetratricopeptide repeat protein [Photobacterium lipolyticum]|uniref:Uncharacterized protein n=1 Tax=Photobacterium lipolyticum TaxID=266810 RepID=A0A2T3N074_9GAMM|nr:hypothetical protein [Photobacterium lipolyticum]PSW05664.1 hypothetical protein C9I89_07905 [Photobacterium lipolyticum]